MALKTIGIFGVANDEMKSGGRVVVMGHLPFLGKLVALLVTGSEKNEIVEFRFGGVVCVERRDNKKWKVAWMVTPSLLHG